MATVEKIGGGTYHGSGASPSSALFGAGQGISSLGPNRLAVIVCWTLRVINSLTPDYHAVDSITSAGLVFTKVFNHDFTYNDPVNSASFPNVYAHCDIFTAPINSILAEQVWSSTMATAGDTFVNDGWCAMYIVADVNAIDANAAAFVVASNLTNTASAITIGPFSTNVSSAIILLAMMGHDNPTPTITLPAGFDTTAAGTSGNSKFDASNSSGSQMEGVLCYEVVASAPSGVTYTTGTNARDWLSVAFALYSSVPPVTTSFGAVIS